MILAGGFILSLQAQDLVKEDYHDNGQVNSTITKHDQEIEVINYYASGQIKEKYYMMDYKRHGVFETWFEDGSRNMVVEYFNNEPTGEWKVWNSEGMLIANAFFVNGNLKSGNMWDANGNPIADSE